MEPAPDRQRAASQLKSAGARILHEVEHHDWGGTDLIVADADGNAVQVFTLDTDHCFGFGWRTGAIPRRLARRWRTPLDFRLVSP